MRMSKIFGIGLSKTGTTSLTKALEILGYSTIHLPDNLDMLEHYDAATDLPIALHYQELDSIYPHSRFILTMRSMNEWLTSMKSHFDRLPPSYVGEYYVSLRRQAYGSEFFKEGNMREAYMAHEHNVRAYFAHRPDDILVLDICGGEGWDKLCRFLNVPIPAEEFPYANQDPIRSVG